MKDYLRRLAGSIVAALVLGSGIAGFSGSASAATVYSGISVTVTTNMCPRGGTVRRANVHIATPGTAGSSSGDTVGGLKAYYGNNQVDGTNFCQTSWTGTGYYWTWIVYRFFSFDGQHTYV